MEYYLKHLRDPPHKPVLDQVASAAIEVFDNPNMLVVNESEVFVEGNGLVCINQESVYSNSYTGVLKNNSDRHSSGSLLT
jgi:hypothetical protein